MNYVWNQDGIKIPEITENRWSGVQLITKGIVIRETVPTHFQTEILEWEASVNPSGWYILIRRGHGRIGEFQGATFNLPLEISVAVRRFA